MTDNNNDFTKGSVSGNIIRIALPLTIAQIVNVLYNVVDRAFIGHIPEVGTAALTGVGVSFPAISLIIAFTNLCGMGGSPLFSIERGRNDKAKASKIMGNACTCLLFFTVLLTVAGYIFTEPLLYLLGASDDTIVYAADYLRVYLSGTLFAMLSTGLNVFINAQGFGGRGMLTVLAGAVCNIILDPIFIFVFNMGVKGAALATVLSQMLSSGLVLSFLCGKKALINLKLSDMKPDFHIIGKIMAVGLSPFVMSVTTAASQILCNATLQRYGGDLYVGIMTVIISLREIMLLAGGGLTQGASPVISYNYGAERYDRTKTGILFVAKLNFLSLFVPYVLLMLFPGFFISIFNDDPALIEVGKVCVRIFFLTHFSMSFQSTGQSCFLALGKSKQAIFFSLLRKALLVMPLVIILPRLFGLGVYGVFLSEPVSDIIGGTACFATFMLRVWPELTEKEKLKASLEEKHE